MSNNTIIEGWHAQPSSNGRGTFDILKTCIGTIFLLCWSSVCPNVPAPKCGFWQTYVKKLNLFLLAVIGPDFVFMVALGQLNSAWKARKNFCRGNHTEWTLRHCFFTNMGGLHLEFRDRKDAGLPTFPVDCEQLLYLVEHGHITLPKIDKDDIDDRNKTDDLARAITVLQTLWFIANSFGRVAQGLYLTTLELTTLAFAFLMTSCSICWWRKPMGILRPVKVHVDVDLSTILREANAPNKLLGCTPLSFLNRREWFLSQFWFYYTQILRNMKLIPSSGCEPAGAACFPSVDFPETEFSWDCYFGWLIPAYSAIFMAAWGFEFPTPVERTLWRIAAGICLGYGFVGSLLAGCWHNRSMIATWYQGAVRRMKCKNQDSLQRSSEPDGSAKRHAKLTAACRRISRAFDWMRNISPESDPTMAVPVRIWIPTTALCIAYSISRGYILVEDLIGLRRLPASAFQTVDWSQYAPIL